MLRDFFTPKPKLKTHFVACVKVNAIGNYLNMTFMTIVAVDSLASELDDK